MTMIERVARAIHGEDYKGLDPDYADIAWDDHQHSYRLQARAAIEAMREPTEGMLDDADEPFHDEWKRQRESNVKAGRDKNAGFGSGPFSSRIWQAMITAALSEGEG